MSLSVRSPWPKKATATHDVPDKVNIFNYVQAEHIIVCVRLYKKTCYFCLVLKLEVLMVLTSIMLMMLPYSLKYCNQ
jgi:hypothetical protein